MKFKRWEIVLQYRDHPHSEQPDYEKAYGKRYLTRRGAERQAAAWWYVDEKTGITCTVRRCP
ncbi:hypothetical protein ABN028_10705 [Actinopolymorpha sp. B17G11]|uniref:hypothetical protein n=1 Tax=Actinopolymorpha sp. B17G11 TaxID=3160861 RepID=UPI0032E3AD52